MGQGVSLSSFHPLYGPVTVFFADVLAPFGVSQFRALELVSAVGTAIAVLIFHASTAHLPLSRARRNLAAGLVAAAPSVVLYATVIEIPGLFLAFASASWWLTTRDSVRPSWTRGALVGAGTAMATMVHQTGHLLAGVSIAFLWSCPRAAGPGRLGTAAVIAASHVAAFTALQKILLGSTATMGEGAAYFLSYLDDRTGLQTLAGVAWREYVLPLFPLSILAFACLFCRGPDRGAEGPGTRMRSALYHVCAAVYLFVSFALVPGLSERGAYALPLVFFAAAMVGRALPRRVLALGLALAAATALVVVVSHDQPSGDLVSADHVLALAPEGRALFVLADSAESDPVVKRAPHLPVMRAVQFAGLLMPGEQLRASFDAYVAQFRQQGLKVYISQGARNFIAKHLPRASPSHPRPMATGGCTRPRSWTPRAPPRPSAATRWAASPTSWAGSCPTGAPSTCPTTTATASWPCSWPTGPASWTAATSTCPAGSRPPTALRPAWSGSTWATPPTSRSQRRWSGASSSPSSTTAARACPGAAPRAAPRFGVPRPSTSASPCGPACRSWPPAWRRAAPPPWPAPRSS